MKKYLLSVSLFAFVGCVAEMDPVEPGTDAGLECPVPDLEATRFDITDSWSCVSGCETEFPYSDGRTIDIEPIGEGGFFTIRTGCPFAWGGQVVPLSDSCWDLRFAGQPADGTACIRQRTVHGTVVYRDTVRREQTTWVFTGDEVP